jgi:hypothetical protein
MSQNTFTPNDRALSALGIGDMFRAQYAVEFADVRLFWNPPGVAAARQYLPASAWSTILPVQHCAAARTLPAARPRPRTILHAGNSLRWFSLPVWVFETTEEYASGLVELAGALKDIPDTHLIVRAKMRHWELNLETLRTLLPSSVEIKTRNEGSFLDDLERADVLIATCSTTIFQALRARKPVLLWGGATRYHHLPPRTTLPSANDRSAVYALEKGQKLSVMLAAILDAHSGAPLQDGEVAPYFWPNGTPGVNDLAEAVAARDAFAPWRE